MHIQRIALSFILIQKVRFNPAAERKEQSTLLVALNRQVHGREQRVIVSGDSDFMNNTEIQRFGVQNASFIIARIFRWFSNGEYPYSPNGEKSKDRGIKVGRKEINWQKLVFFAILPAIVIVLGTIVLVRRKRK